MARNNVQKIAEKAGVSIATVSRILNGKLGHAPETIRRVQALARELAEETSKPQKNSVPCSAIGVVVYQYPDFICNAYVSFLLDGIVSAANALGYSSMIITLSENTCNPEYLRNMVAFYRLQGLIIPGNHYLYKLLNEISRYDIPMVGINAVLQNSIPEVRADALRKGEEAASYLLHHRHRRVGLVSISGDSDHEHFCAGFRRIFQKSAPEEKIQHWLFHDINESIFGALNSIATSAAPPTALVFANSQLARRFYLGLRGSNIQIPEDISILSCEEHGELLDLGITTLAQPTQQMGKAAVKLLMKCIQSSEKVEDEVFICTFKERSSVRNLNTESFHFHYRNKFPQRTSTK